MRSWTIGPVRAGVAVFLALLCGGWSADAERAVTASAVIFTYLGFSIAILGAHHRRKRAGDLAMQGMSSANAAEGEPILVAFASQTGFAEQLALQTARSLQSAGMPVRVKQLGNVEAGELPKVKRALFVVSTTGEGDAPDSVAGFARKVMDSPLPLAGLHYGILSLGDREYRNFCGFGRAFGQWLSSQKATALFDDVEVDNADEGALRHWQHHLRLLSGGADQADWTAPAYGRWKLVERRLLNEGSPGGPVFHVALEPLDQAVRWMAGDIAEVGPRNAREDVGRLLESIGANGEMTVEVEGQHHPLAELLSRSLLPKEILATTAQSLAGMLKPLPHREYSVASLPSDGRLELLVRQVRHLDGRLGLGSGWLTAHAPIGGEIALRVRENRGFHPPPADHPLILIGNGTGLSGLRAHIKARAAAAAPRNWLFFGERTAAHDLFYRAEIEAWQAQGVLSRIDLAFSRDQPDRIYVQDRLRQAAAELQAWVGAGATILVCGSLEGMAAGVNAALADILGEEGLQLLVEAGRYRRDVY